MTVTISRILLPTRFAALSRRAAEYVRLLATAVGAELHLVHVVPTTELIVDPGIAGVAIPVMGPSVTELLDQSRQRLAAFVREVFPDLAERTRTAAVLGGIADELTRYAAAQRIDLIIMGTHADGMLRRFVFGSVGKSVLEAAPCPVLLVPVHGSPR